MTTLNRIIQLDIDNRVGFSDKRLRAYIKHRVADTGANFVYLQVSVEKKRGDGNNRTADTLLFDPAPFIKNAVVEDPHLFVKAVHMIRELVPSCQILAWVPSLYSTFLMDGSNDEVRHATRGNGACDWYKRASPFLAQTHTRLKAFFNALGRSTEELDGIMFQDDLLLSDWEDISDAGREVLNSRYHLGGADMAALNTFLESNDEGDADYTKNRDWRSYKTAVLDNLSTELFRAFQKGYRDAFPQHFEIRQKSDATKLKCGRDYYSNSILKRNSKIHDWYAQNIDTALDIYDHVVVMVYLNMDTHLDPASPEAASWLKKVAGKAIAIANSNGRVRAHKLVFKLQSMIWTTGAIISADVLQQNANDLLSMGAVNIGFYPALQGNSYFDMEVL